jgi:hypothetical protein
MKPVFGRKPVYGINVFRIGSEFGEIFVKFQVTPVVNRQSARSKGMGIRFRFAAEQQSNLQLQIW